MFVNKCLVGLAPEVTQGTYVNPATGDAVGTPQIFPAYNVKFNAGGDLRVAPELSQRLGQRPGIADVSPTNISFDIRVKGRTGAGTAPTERLAFMACGLAEEVTGATSVAYRPTYTYDGTAGGAGIGTRPAISYSGAVWIDGMKFTLAGGRGKGTLLLKAGEPIVLSVSLDGYYNSAITEALPTPAGVSTFEPPVVASIALAPNFGGAWNYPSFESLSLDFGAEIAEVPDANAGNFGRKGYDLVNLKPTGSYDPKMVVNATHDFYALWQAGTVGSFATTTIGTGAGHRVTLTIAGAQYAPPQHGERAGHLTNSQRFNITTAATATECSEFTILIS